MLSEVFHRLKFLQVEQLAFQQAKEVFNHCIVQTVFFAAHALLDTLVFADVLGLLVLVLPAWV